MNQRLSYLLWLFKLKRKSMMIVLNCLKVAWNGLYFCCVFLFCLFYACLSSRNRGIASLVWLSLCIHPYIYIYPCCDPPISVSVLFVLVCAGRFAPMASGCTTILSFLTNCTYDRDSLTVKTRTFNMLMFIKILTINISCKLSKFW
jgi:hypothetical protein